MAADVKFLIEFNSNGEPVIRNITGEVDKLGQAAERGGRQQGIFQNALQGVFREMGVGERAATALASGLGRVNLIALPLTAAFFALKIQERLTQPLIEADEAAANFLRSKNLEGLRDQVQAFKDIVQEREAIGFGGTIFSRIRGLIQGTNEALSSETLSRRAEQAADQADAVRLFKQKEITAAIRDQIDLVGKTLPDAIRISGAALERDLLGKLQELKTPNATELARKLASGITGARLAEEQRQANLTIAEQVRALSLQSASLNATANQVVQYGTAAKIAALATSELARAHGGAIAPIAQMYQQLERGQIALNNFNRGKAGVSGFEQLFGVSLDSSRSQTAVQLADAFIPVFNQFGRDPRNAAAFQQAFQSLVQQALATGAADIPELIVSRGLSSANFERLAAGLGGDLRRALDESRQAGQQWGASLEQETFRVTQSFAQVGAAIDAIARQLAAIQNRALNIPITFSESPARPFSEFIPTMQRHFTDLNSLVESRTPNIDIPVSGLPQQIAGLYGTPGFSAAYTQYQNLTRAIATERDNYYAGFTAMNYGIGQANMATAARRQAQFQAQLDTLLVTAGSDAYGAARSGGGGGGAPSVAVTIDLRGSNVTPGFLDDSLIPALERGIIRATGQAPDFRVLN